MYQLQTFQGQVVAIKRISDGCSIPMAKDNTDAQQFARWLQEGNKPEPADEGGAVTDEWVHETIAKLLG